MKKKLQKKLIASLCCVLLIINTIPASVFADYNTVNSDIAINKGNHGLVYASGKYVMVGDNGNIMTSTDAINWTVRTSPTISTINDIIYNGSKFIAVGNSGTILVSSDAITWTKQTAVTSANLESICLVNGITHVIVGSSGCILTSTDYINWTVRTSNTTLELSKVYYASGKTIAVGLDGTILTSSDTITWTTRTSNSTNDLTTITYASSKFVVGGYSGTIITSADGITWTVQTSPTTATINDIKYYNSKFILVGSSGVILTSTDAITWTAQVSTTTKALNKIIYANSIYVVAVNEACLVLTSSNGTSWTVRDTEELPYLDKVIFANNQFIAVGDRGTVAISSNGIDWVKQSTGITSRLYSIAYGNGLYVAVGSGGKIITSADGVTWVARTSNTTNALCDVKYGNNFFIAVGSNGTIITSANGSDWVSKTSGVTNTLYAVVCNSGKYIAVGSSGCILYSLGGDTWSTRTSGTTQSLYDIAYGSGYYVAVGTLGTILQSTTGSVWNSRGSILYLLNIDSVIYSKGEFVTAGGLGNIRSSKTGSSWDTILDSSAYSLCSVAYGNSRFVATGDNIVKFTSDVLPPTITLAEPSSWQNGSVTITVTFDDDTYISMPKWAAGVQTVDYFASSGNYFSGNTFNVPSNGVYTVYAKDQGNLESVKTITVTKQDVTSPIISDVVVPTTWGTTNTINVSITDEQSGVAVQKYAIGTHDSSYFVNNGIEFTGNSFSVSQIGPYTIYAKDNMGLTTVYELDVDKIDTTAPMISLSALSNWSNENTITANITDVESGVSIKKWAYGNLTSNYFSTNGNEFTEDVIPVTNNGIYTIYSKDTVGNEAVQTITINNLYEFNKLGEYEKTFNDLSISSVGLPISFSRTYQSYNSQIGIFGEGWKFSYEGSCKDYQCVFVDANNITHTESIPTFKVIKMPDGSKFLFKLDNGIYSSYNTRSTLIKNIDNTFSLTTKEKITYTFNTNGDLSIISDKNGNTTTINYVNGKISTIIDSVNRTYTISYGTNDLVSSIVDFSGRMVQYQYNGNKLINVIDPKSQLTTQYSYDTEGYLNSIKDGYLTLQESVIYHHFCSGEITSIRNEKGEYTSYSYNNNIVTETDNLDNQTTYEYNDYMQLISTSNSTGESLTTYYNLYDDIQSYTDFNGIVTNYTIDNSGNVLNITSTDGKDEAYTFDINNNLLSSEDANGNMIYYEYDGNNNLIKSAQPKNGTDLYSVTSDQSKFIITQYSYNDNGTINSIISPDGTTTQNTYDEYGNVIKINDSSVGITRFIYDAVGNMIRKITPSLYNSLNDGLNDSIPTNSYRDSNIGETMTYDMNGNVLTDIDLSGNNKYYTYDLHDKLIKENIDNNITRYVYDSHGWLIQQINPQQYSSNDDGLNNNPIDYTYSNLNVGTKYTYDNVGNTISIIDSTNSNNTNYYDGKNQLLRTDNGEKITRYLYNTNGKLIQKISPSQYDPTKDGLNNSVPVNSYTNSDGSDVAAGERYTYDSTGNVDTYIDSDNIITSYQYDSKNNIIKMVHNNFVTRYLYDENNRLSQLIDSDQYDPAKDGLSNSTPTNTYLNTDGSSVNVGKRYTYDGNGNVLTFIDKDNVTISYNYDVNNNKIMTDCSGAITRYVYNISNQLIQVIYPDQYNELFDGLKYSNPVNIYSDSSVGDRYTYDSYGNVLTHTNSKNIVTTNKYDSNNNLIKSDKNNFITRYLYDNNNRLIQKINPEQYDASKDGLNNITNPVNEYKNPDGSSVDAGDRYTYDINGNVISHTDSDNNTDTNTYTGDGKIISSNNSNGTIFNYNITSGNVDSEQYLNGLSNSITYTDDNMLNQLTGTISGNTIYNISINYSDKKIQQYAETFGLHTRNFTYDYDSNGNIINIMEYGLQKVKYYYDFCGQLIRENNYTQGQTISYEYDASGNILCKKIYNYTTANDLSNLTPYDTILYSYEDTNDSNRLTNYDGNPITYNNEGSMSTFNGWSFTWGNGNLNTAINGTNNISYLYNANGIRTSKTINGVSTTYQIDDNNNVTNETTGSDIQNYFYNARGTLTYFTYNGAVYYYEKNAQGDIIGLVDTNGDEVVSYLYDSWGKVRSVRGPAALTIGIKNPFRYRGYYYDTETGLYYLQSRYYNPDLSRFISNDDPSYTNTNNILSSNLYIYCYNNPIMFIDSEGHKCTADDGYGSWANYSNGFWYIYDGKTHTYYKLGASGISTAGVEFIKEKESFRANKYKALPSEKYYTIGYGHYMSDGKSYVTISGTRYYSLTKPQANSLLLQDLKLFTSNLNKFLSTNGILLSQYQYDACIADSFQKGQNIWGNSKYLISNYIKAGNFGNYNACLIAFLGGTTNQGLINRRTAEAKLFYNGYY